MPAENLPRAADDAASRDSPGQQELFETNPPPWEMPADQLVTLASVVFAEAPHGPFDYVVPEAMQSRIQPGMRVRVPLGHRRNPLTGWCIEIKPDQPPSRKQREVAAPLDPEPLCDLHLVKLVLWISHYYQTPPGVVFDALIPAGVRSAAGTREQAFLTPAPLALDDALVDKLPVKQRAAIRHLIAAGQEMTLPQLMVTAECTEAPIRQLVKKGFLRMEKRRVLLGQPHRVFGSADADGASGQEITELTSEQSEALACVVAAIDAGKAATLLLHGVTGSGKTEVYIRAIEDVVRFGRAAIVLVPEISLTPQTRARFQSRFDGVAVLHSHMSPTERHHHWQQIAAAKCRSSSARGARSSHRCRSWG